MVPLPSHPLCSNPKTLITSLCLHPSLRLSANFCGSLSPPSLLFPALGPRSASLLSLQTELLLDLVAEAQSRRLEEQRATFHAPPNPPSLAPAPPRPLEDKEQLYSTILSHQVRQPQEATLRPPGLSPFSFGLTSSFYLGIHSVASL